MLRQADCIKRKLNTDGLTLQADAGESFLVKAIYVGRVNDDSYLSAKINNVSVAYYLVKGKRGNKLGGIRLSYYGLNLMDVLVKRGLPFALPIAEGQKLTIDKLTGIGSIQVVYDTYDAGDIRADMPNGTDCKTFGFIQHLTETIPVTASGLMLLDKTNTAVEFPDFPAGKPVPAKMKIKIHGVEGSPFSCWTSDDVYFQTTFLKFVKERTVLFDEDRLGIPFLGHTDPTELTEYANTETIIGSVGEVSGIGADLKVAEPFFFDPPLEFEAGEELNVYLAMVREGAATLTADMPDIALIMEVNKE